MTEHERYLELQHDPAFRTAVKAAKRLIDTLPFSDRRHAAIEVARGYDGLDGLAKLTKALEKMGVQ